MKKTILVATIGALTLGVNAGDWGKAPVDKAPVGKAPIEECVDLGGEISVGYMSDYIYKGLRLAGDSVWMDVNYTIDGLPVPVTVGAWYLNGINEAAFPPLGGSFDELDLYAIADLGTVAGFDVSLGYTHRTYPEIRNNLLALAGPFIYTGFGELGVNLRRDLGFADFLFQSNYAMGGWANGWYHQAGLERAFGLTDNIDLVLGAGVAYSDGYFGNVLLPTGSGWNHYYVTASLPIQLNCRTVLTPYVGYVGAPDGWIVDGVLGPAAINPFPQSDILHGGVSLSVSF